MKLKRQRNKICICIFERIVCDERSRKEKKKHGNLFPNNIRYILCSPSNCGNTNVMFNLLFDPHGLRFENVYVFSKSIYQSKYIFLNRIFSKISLIGYHTFSDNEEVIYPNEAKSNSVIVFDHIACENLVNIRNYFTMGGHNNIVVFYLYQSYSKIPKQLIRGNTRFLIVFRQDELYLKHIYADHINTDMSCDMFKDICNKIWLGNKYTFLVIDKESEINCGCYRIELDIYINI